MNFRNEILNLIERVVASLQLATYIFTALLLCSCDKEEYQYHKIFKFHHTEVTNEKGFVKVDSQTYVEIDSRTGSLGKLRDLAFPDYNGFIKKNFSFYYTLESFEFINKEQMRIRFWSDGKVEFGDHEGDVENVNGILRENFLGAPLIWDRNKQEIRFCLMVLLYYRHNLYPDFQEDICDTPDFNEKCQSILLNSDIPKKDSVGIYQMEMVYKE